MDLMTALQLVMKKSSAHDGLVKGLLRLPRPLRSMWLSFVCWLKTVTSLITYVKLIKALYAEHNVHLVMVPSAKTLGECVGVRVSYCLQISDPTCLYLIEACRKSNSAND
jgi:small subunit ribosomal protein S12e